MLVGRDRELAWVQDALAGPGTVALLGEAGVGKTALLREAARGTGRRVLEGGALSTLSWMPYLPLERALGRGLAGGDAAWAAFEVERVVRDGVLVLDDLQWADRETVELLPQLHGRMALATAVRRGDPASEPVLEALGRLGVEPLALEPLDEAAAAVLVGRVDPGLREGVVRRIVARAGGNPFLLEELAASGQPTESVQRALGARIRKLEGSARAAFALLALAGRPLPRALLAGEEGALRDSGLVTVDGEHMTVRHALLADAATAELNAPERRGLHLRLARLLDDPGERARHFDAAGERALAHRYALEAVEATSFPGERAHHLALAARNADGPDADRLRVAAAAALVEANSHDDVEALLDAVESADSRLVAEASLVRIATREVAVDYGGVLEAWRTGRGALTDADVELKLRFAVEEARVAYLVERELDRALELATRAASTAVASARHVPLARFVLGSVRSFSLADGWDTELRAAVAAAREEGDIATEHRAANNLAYGLLVDGRALEARDVAKEMAVAARRRRLLGWQRRFRGWLVGIDWHVGDLQTAAGRGLELLEEPLETSDRRLASFYLAEVLADLGRHAEARLLVDRLAGETVLVRPEPLDGETEEHIEALWASADMHLLAGRPREARAAAEQCLQQFEGLDGPERGLAFLQVTRAWAEFDLEVPVTRSAVVADRPLVEAVPVELDAIDDLADGRYDEAADRFSAAAELWRQRHFRGHLRCRWAKGEALRRAGSIDTALETLIEAEQLAAAAGHTPFGRRIERSLRLCGERRSAARGAAATGGALTTREREVLALVGEGLSNDAIAQRLGVGRPTVARIVQSASRKLGATSRAQAAALAARLPGH